MFKDLRGSRALLTGASRGLGVPIALGLAAEGIELVLAARDQAKLADVAAKVEKAGGRAQIVAGDLARAADRAWLVEQAGAIDLLINNAAVETPKRLGDQSDDEVRLQLETNLAAPIDLTRRVLGGMLERRRGVIVNISSMAGKGPTPFNVIYAATKHGLNGFTASLALELDGTGVHAGVVCPGFVAEAGMWADYGGRAPALMKEVSPARVVAAVLAVIHGAREVLVTAGPMRPMLALAQIFPSLDRIVLRRSGIFDALAQRAARLAGR